MFLLLTEHYKQFKHLLITEHDNIYSYILDS